MWHYYRGANKSLDLTGGKVYRRDITTGVLISPYHEQERKVTDVALLQGC